MSPRKKNTSKAGPSKQPTISNFFQAKAKHASASTRPKRLAQSSLTARPLGSKKSPDLEILDLTQSTSPVGESESPPSAKKRKLKATSPDQSPVRVARVDSFPSAPSRSTSPVSYISREPAESGARNDIPPAFVSPTPSQIGRSQQMLDIDPDEIVESSQTQYLHLRFTPSPQRVTNVDPGRVLAPVFTPVPTRIREQSHEPSSTRVSPGPLDAMEEHQSTVFVPSSQDDISEPFTPRKRNRTFLDQFGANVQTPSGAVQPDAQGPNAVGPLIGTPKRQPPPSIMPPPGHPVFANTPIKNRLVVVNPFTPQFSSLQPIPSPMYPSERSDQISGSEDPSIAATELGTVESPPKPPKYTTVATNLLPLIPESVPTNRDTPHTQERTTILLLQTSNVNPNSPRTPHRGVPDIPPSSPTNFPSPGRLMSSLGFQTSRDAKHVRQSGREATVPPAADETPTYAHVPEVIDSQLQGEESPRRRRSSSLTVVPSSQPLHDSSPPPEYDLDPKRHSFNQGRLQSFNQPTALDLSPPTNSSRPHFTASAHHPPSPSSQSLPPSQTPIKGGQVDPNQSTAGMRGVFGMLGFGSEVDNHDTQTEAHKRDVDGLNVHIPTTHDLPPSSPPPQSPTCYESRESSPYSYLIPASGQKDKAKPRSGKTKTSVHDSPLARAFEAAKKRSKTATPSAARRPTSKVSQIASSPIRPTHSDDMDVDSSPLRDSQPNNKRAISKAGKINTGPSVAQTPTFTERLRRASRATQPKSSQSTRQTGSSGQTQHRTPVDREIVESSDAEEMEIDVPPSPVFPASTRATAGGKSSGEPTKLTTITLKRDPSPIRASREPEDWEYAPAMPVREEYLPSSVSPSPTGIHHSPPPQNSRYSSPPLAPSENTQTQEEPETPWESLRPSQSVSQVYERQLIEEAERERRLRIEQNAEKQKAKVLVEDSPGIPKDQQAEKVDRTESQQQQESPEHEPVRPVTISLDPCSPTNVPDETPRLALPHSFSTPQTRRTTEKVHYVVTPTKFNKRTPARATPSRKSMTPSSMAGDDDPEADYTYVEETFDPTESQRSFLNRILQGDSNELG
ncbi:hypothetical protein OPQ81_004087 [Rhizoctonia solani]|nr:hypothetical protein OPQ81_004087 [Rhizoctonia solani]